MNLRELLLATDLEHVFFVMRIRVDGAVNFLQKYKHKCIYLIRCNFFIAYGVFNAVSIQQVLD